MEVKKPVDYLELVFDGSKKGINREHFSLVSRLISHCRFMIREETLELGVLLVGGSDQLHTE